MATIKHLDDQYKSFSVIEQFVSAYQRLTIYQMQQRRNAVLKNRTYMNGLLDSYIDVKQTTESLFSLSQDKTSLQFTSLQKNGKSAAVFLSFETKFSAETIRTTFDFFAQSVKGRQSDIIIVGSRGRQLLNEYFPKGTPYIYSPLTESDVESGRPLKLTSVLLNYERVDIFHPYFISILEQKPVESNISGDIPFDQDLLRVDRQGRHFLFEPDREKILHFFEIQIFAALLQQKVKEAHLATLGARITNLETTQQNITKKIKLVGQLRGRMVRTQKNKKQRNRMTGMAFWSDE